jgi:hypothetical protein
MIYSASSPATGSSSSSSSNWFFRFVKRIGETDSL